MDATLTAATYPANVVQDKTAEDAPVSSEMRQAGYLLVASDVAKDPEPENDNYFEILARGDFEICLYQPAIVTRLHPKHSHEFFHSIYEQLPIEPFDVLREP